MTMNIQPGHIFLIAAKHDFMSQSIKTGSFVSFNFSNVKGRWKSMWKMMSVQPPRVETTLEINRMNVKHVITHPSPK